MSEWLKANVPWIVIFASFILALSILFIPDLRQYWPSFFPDFVATGLGITMGASLSLLIMEGRHKRAHNKFYVISILN